MKGKNENVPLPSSPPPPPPIQRAEVHRVHTGHWTWSRLWMNPFKMLYSHLTKTKMLAMIISAKNVKCCEVPMIMSAKVSKIWRINQSPKTLRTVPFFRQSQCHIFYIFVSSYRHLCGSKILQCQMQLKIETLKLSRTFLPSSLQNWYGTS